MSKFKTEFYDRATGVNFTVSWADEQQYLLGKAFLDQLIGESIGRFRPDRPDFYILETEQQREAMLEFRQALRKKR